MTAITLPRSEESELTVLGRILWGSKETPKLLISLSEEDFYLDRHKMIFGAMRRLGGLGSIDIVSVAAELQKGPGVASVGGDAYLMDLVDGAVSDAGLEYHVNIIKEKSILRAVIEGYRPIYQDAADGMHDASEILDKLFHLLSKNSDKLVGEKDENPQSILPKILNNEEPIFLKTGFRFIDESIKIQPSNLIIVGGFPGGGKTSLAMGIAAHVSIGGKVIVNSLEMNADELTENISSAISGIKLNRIIERQLDPVEMDRIERQWVGRNIKICSIPRLNELRNYIRANHSPADPIKLLIVDYLQLMQSQGSNRTEEVGRISRGLKQLAMEFKIPIIALSQLTREAAGQEPMLKHLRESGSIEQDANAVAFVWRQEDESNFVRRFSIAKNRRGEITCGEKATRAGWDGSTVRFYDYAPEERGEEWE
jgi:replicative DNA helicase